MTGTEIVVTGAGIGLIAGLANFFFGPKQARRAEVRGGVQEVEITAQHPTQRCTAAPERLFLEPNKTANAVITCRAKAKTDRTAREPREARLSHTRLSCKFRSAFVIGYLSFAISPREFLQTFG